VNPRFSLTRQQLLRLLDGATVQVSTSVGLLEVESVPDPAWQPLVKGEVTPAIRVNHTRTGQQVPDELWANDTYEVFVYRLAAEMAGGPDATHLSIKRYDRAPVRNWRHFQQIKNEIVGPEIEAMELFPRESRLADNANQYHLWCLPPDMDVPVGWDGGMVLIQDDEVRAYNDAPHNGRQEPRQEGLTVGDTLDGARTPEQTEQIRHLLGVKS
jgi:hypothetical protein